MNMLDRERLASKKESKTEAVQSTLADRLGADDIHIGPSDYIPWLNDNKLCFLRMEGNLFGDVPMNLELRLSVEDSPNSAGGRGRRDPLLQGRAGPRHRRRADRPVGLFLQASAAAVQRRRRRPADRGVHRRRRPRRRMNCLIIAAGHGSRLRDVSPSKPLTPVAGMPLIEHVHPRRRGGRSDRASPSSPAMRPRGSRRSSPGSTVSDRDGARRGLGPAQRPFGARRRRAGSRAIICWPWPTICSIPRSSARLIAAPAAALTLAVDRDLANPLLDMDDATKVETGRGRRDRPDRQDARPVRRDRHRPVPRHAGAGRGDRRRRRQPFRRRPAARRPGPRGDARRHRPLLARRRRSRRARQGRGAAGEKPS